MLRTYSICCIPICEQHDDSTACHFDKKDLFSVKSAYRVYTEILRCEATIVRGESSARSTGFVHRWLSCSEVKRSEFCTTLDVDGF
jgi:hypothetical protein